VPPPEPEPPPRAAPASGSRTKAVEPIAVIKSVPPPPASLPPEPPRPVAAVATTTPARTSTGAPKRRSFPVLLVAVFAVAAVVTFVLFRGPRATTEASARPADPPSPATTSLATATATANATAAPSEGTLDAKDLPAAASASAAPSAHAAPASPHPSSSATAKVTTVALPDAPGGERGDLGGAMRDAVGSRDPAEAPPAETATSPGARQLRPSPGAVVGAINSVLPAARECLGPDDPVRGATIVFKSDGTVARVDMSGDRPTDACVRAALSRARVAPFVDDTFAARATVRP
jgi:hypothetical protein